MKRHEWGTVSAEQVTGLGCGTGDHDACSGLNTGYLPPRACECGCHIEPWPFEHDG